MVCAPSRQTLLAVAPPAPSTMQHETRGIGTGRP